MYKYSVEVLQVEPPEALTNLSTPASQAFLSVICCERAARCFGTSVPFSGAIYSPFGEDRIAVQLHRDNSDQPHTLMVIGGSAGSASIVVNCRERQVGVCWVPICRLSDSHTTASDEHLCRVQLMWEVRRAEDGFLMDRNSRLSLAVVPGTVGSLASSELLPLHTILHSPVDRCAAPLVATNSASFVASILTTAATASGPAIATIRQSVEDNADIPQTQTVVVPASMSLGSQNTLWGPSEIWASLHDLQASHSMRTLSSAIPPVAQVLQGAARTPETTLASQSHSTDCPAKVAKAFFSPEDHTADRGGASKSFAALTHEFPLGVTPLSPLAPQDLRSPPSGVLTASPSSSLPLSQYECTSTVTRSDSDMRHISGGATGNATATPASEHIPRSTSEFLAVAQGDSGVEVPSAFRATPTNSKGTFQAGVPLGGATAAVPSPPAVVANSAKVSTTQGLLSDAPVPEPLSPSGLDPIDDGIPPAQSYHGATRLKDVYSSGTQGRPATFDLNRAYVNLYTIPSPSVLLLDSEGTVGKDSDRITLGGCTTHARGSHGSVMSSPKALQWHHCSALEAIRQDHEAARMLGPSPPASAAGQADTSIVVGKSALHRLKDLKLDKADKKVVAYITQHQCDEIERCQA